MQNAMAGSNLSAADTRLDIAGGELTARSDAKGKHVRDIVSIL